MLTLSHYKFKERLLYKSQTMGCKVHICNESYTTKTCGKCGNIQHVGRKEVFLCTKCEFKIDRDYNGARNIYLKVIEELIPD
jgi:putative transposase